MLVVRKGVFGQLSWKNFLTVKVCMQKIPDNYLDRTFYSLTFWFLKLTLRIFNVTRNNLYPILKVKRFGLGLFSVTSSQKTIDGQRSLAMHIHWGINEARGDHVTELRYSQASHIGSCDVTTSSA